MSKKIQCDFCGVRRTPEELNLWWTVRPGEVEAYNLRLSCPDCGLKAESFCQYNRAVLACDIPLAALAVRFTDLTASYSWRNRPRLLRLAKRVGYVPPSRKAAKSKDTWTDDDPVGKKRQRLVKWLMRKPRLVPLAKAKTIAARKYPLL